MTISPSSFLTSSLRGTSWGGKVSRIMAASLSAVHPYQVIQDQLFREGNLLNLPGHVLDLDKFSGITLLSVGKAALPLAVSSANLIENKLNGAYILTKKGKADQPERFKKQLRIFTGGHPIPDQDSLQATTEILSRLSSLKEDELVLVLISGGSSALLTSPVEGVTLEDLQKTNQVLLSCGADIVEINTLRKHLSRVKGGQLARILQPAHIYTLILSDVIGDHIDMVGSGPTAPDPTTYADALAVVANYQLEEVLPHSVITWLEQGRQGKQPETPKPGDPAFKNVSNLILSNNQQALEAGAEQARIEGFHTNTLPQFLVGEARDVGRKLAKQLTELSLKDRPFPSPACLIAGGETTVTLTDSNQTGKGGRNLETALSALPLLDGLENIALITLATDGEDGPTDAAGAVVTGDSYQRCQQLGFKPEDHLDGHDSYTAFESLDDLLRTGPTGTNVNDMCFLFTF